MRTIFYITLLLLTTAQAGFCRYRQATDTVAARTTTADSTPKKPAVTAGLTTAPATTTPATPAAGNTRDSAALRTNTDSLSMVKSLEEQRKMGIALYKNKTASFVLPALASLVLVAGLGLFLLFTTPLCKDQSIDPKTNQLRPVRQRPYSYARIQLFWWTMLIFWCICSFYFYTGVLLALTPSVVILLSGGLAVSVFGNVMDNAQRVQNTVPVPVRHQDIRATDNLLADILSDEGGISIHRLQAVLANLIFGMAFISTFMRSLNVGYPLMDFESWQLTLLGASAAGYLGFKANENSRATITERQVEAVADLPATGARETLEAAPAKQPPATPAIYRLKASLQQKGIID